MKLNKTTLSLLTAGFLNCISSTSSYSLSCDGLESLFEEQKGFVYALNEENAEIVNNLNRLKKNDDAKATEYVAIVKKAQFVYEKQEAVYRRAIFALDLMEKERCFSKLSQADIKALRDQANIELSNYKKQIEKIEFMLPVFCSMYGENC